MIATATLADELGRFLIVLAEPDHGGLVALRERVHRAIEAGGEADGREDLRRAVSIAAELHGAVHAAAGRRPELARGRWLDALASIEAVLEAHLARLLRRAG